MTVGPHAPARLPAARPLLPTLIVALGFLGSRAVYRWGLGVRFDAHPLKASFHLLDQELLRHDLLRSVFYLHHQAPLVNLLAGVALKLFPASGVGAIAATFFVLGLLMALSMEAVLRDLGVSPRLRVVATLLFSASPATVLYESWLMYHHLVIAFLVMALAALLRFLRTGSRLSGSAFFGLLALVALTRSIYGIAWMASVTLVLLLLRPLPRGLVLRVAAAPLLVVLLHTVKAPLLFGRSLGHAMLAPNLAVKVLFEIPAEEQERLYRDGKISPVTRLLPFFDLSVHPEFRVALPETSVPSLDEEHTSSGVPNAHALEYVYIADVYMKDARWLITHYPGAYLRGAWRALSDGFLRSATYDLPDTQPGGAVEPVDRWVQRLLLLRDDRLWGLTLGLPLSLLYGVAWLLGPRARMRSSRSTTPAVAVMVVTILYVAGTTLVSYGAFSRYRFEVDGYFLMLGTLLASALLRRLRTTKRVLRG